MMRRLLSTMLATLVFASGCSSGAKKDNDTSSNTTPSAAFATSPGPTGELKAPCIPTKTDVVFVIFVATYQPEMNDGQGGYNIATYQTDNGPDKVDPNSIVPNLEKTIPGKNGKLVWSVAPYVTPVGGYALMKSAEGPSQEVILKPTAREISAPPSSTIASVHFCGTMKIRA